MREVDPHTEFVEFGTGRGQQRTALATFGGERVARARRHGDRCAEPVRDQAAGLRHRRGHRRCQHPGLPRALRTQPRLPFGGRCATQRICLAANGIRPLLRRTHGQTRLDLRGARGLGGDDRFAAIHGLGVERRDLLSVVQARLELGQLLHGGHSARLEFVALPIESLPLLLGGTGLQPEPAELLVHRRDRRVGLVERGERMLGRILTRRLLGECTGQRRGQLPALTLDALEFASRLFDFGRDLQSAYLAVGSTVDEAGTHDVAVGGDRAQPRSRRHQIQCGPEIFDHRDAAEHRDDGAAQTRRGIDEIEGPQRTVGQRRPPADRRRPANRRA